MTTNNPRDFIIEAFSTEPQSSLGSPTNTGVKITHIPTGMSVQTSEYPTSLGNRHAAWNLMREALEAAEKPRIRDIPAAQTEALAHWLLRWRWGTTELNADDPQAHQAWLAARTIQKEFSLIGPTP